MSLRLKNVAYVLQGARYVTAAITHYLIKQKPIPYRLFAG